MKMKNDFMSDMGKVMDEIFEAAESFGDAFHDGLKNKCGSHFCWDENVDYYPSYSYPPANVYLTKEKELVFQFAMAGFNEKSIELEFKGDYMLFSAKIPEELISKSENRYFKHRLKFKDINKQKYYVPADKFDQEKVKAVFKNGILHITIPPNNEIKTPEGIKIEIVKEGD